MNKKDKSYMCNARFASTRDVNAHVVKHSGVKAFKCNLCNKTFSHISSVKNHMIIHTEDRNKLFTCDLCDKIFLTNTVLITTRM